MPARVVRADRDAYAKISATAAKYGRATAHLGSGPGKDGWDQGRIESVQAKYVYF